MYLLVYSYEPDNWRQNLCKEGDICVVVSFSLSSCLENLPICMWLPGMISYRSFFFALSLSSLILSAEHLKNSETILFVPRWFCQFRFFCWTSAMNFHPRIYIFIPFLSFITLPTFYWYSLSVDKSVSYFAFFRGRRTRLSLALWEYWKEFIKSL